MKESQQLTGQDIQTAAKCIEKVGNEIDAMLRYIEEDLTDCLYEAKLIQEDGLKSGGDEYKGNDWVTSGYLCNYGLIPPKGKSPKAVIAIKVSLIENAQIQGLDEPLLHVLFCGGSLDDGSWEFDEFELPPKKDDDCSVTLRSDRLWEWFCDGDSEGTDLAWDNRLWAFSLPLIEINTLDDIRKNITETVTRLLNGQEPEKAFETASEVIRYRLDGSDYIRSND